jgi:hypothetical protein
LIGNLWSGDLLVFKIGFSGLDSHCPVRIFDSTEVLMKYYFLHFKMTSTCIIIGLSRLPLSVFWWLKFQIEYNISMWSFSCHIWTVGVHASTIRWYKTIIGDGGRWSKRAHLAICISCTVRLSVMPYLQTTQICMKRPTTIY